MIYNIAVLEGDGIGPEIVRATMDVLRALEHRSGSTMYTFIPLHSRNPGL